MSKINTIALNTFKENVRNKVLYVILSLAVLLIVFSIFLGEWSVFNSEYVIKSFTLSVLSLSGLLLSIFIGVGLVQNEIQKKTIYTIVTKPVFRIEFIVGKYLGLLYILFCHLALLSSAFVVVLLLSDASITVSLLYGLLLKGVEMALVIAVALFFSTFSSAALSSFFTCGIYIAGHTLPEVLEQIALSKKIAAPGYSAIQEKIAQGLFAILPDFSIFDCTAQIVHSIQVNPFVVLTNSLYGLVYILLFLSCGVWIFSRKEFT